MAPMGKRIHVLKCWPESFDAVLAGRKRFEIRKRDRDYQVGDYLVLRRFDPELKEYTDIGFGRDFGGAWLMRLVTYMTVGTEPWAFEGFVVLSLSSPKDIHQEDRQMTRFVQEAMGLGMPPQLFWDRVQSVAP